MQLVNRMEASREIYRKKLYSKLLEKLSKCLLCLDMGLYVAFCNYPFYVCIHQIMALLLLKYNFSMLKMQVGKNSLLFRHETEKRCNPANPILKLIPIAFRGILTPGQ